MTPQTKSLATGITNITRGPMDLGLAPDAPPGQTWAYQICIPFQIGPNQAMLSVNKRVCGSRVIDLEAGGDLILIDALDPIHILQRFKVSEIEIINHPRTGEKVYMNGGFTEGGFVPLGAKRDDGSPHPHAGTGFSLIVEHSYPVKLETQEDTHLDPKSDVYTRVQIKQLAFDGKRLEITHEETFEETDLFPGTRCLGLGLSAAIPDGDDLVVGANMGCFAHWMTGFTRWQRVDGRWQLTDFRVVDPHAMEPTIVRDPLDGSLLMGSRADPSTPTILAPTIYRSVDGGKTWKRVFAKRLLEGWNPIVLNRALDGTLYFASNRHHLPLVHRLAKRNMIWAWPVTDDRTDTLDPILVRDGPTEFGPAPTPNSTWRLDHPVGTNLRLADGVWRHILAYRVLDDAEMYTTAGPSDRTGTYLEEVITRGEPLPIWKF